MVALCDQMSGYSFLSAVRYGFILEEYRKTAELRHAKDSHYCRLNKLSQALRRLSIDIVKAKGTKHELNVNCCLMHFPEAFLHDAITQVAHLNSESGYHAQSCSTPDASRGYYHPQLPLATSSQVVHS
jgi:hypothetical protein